MDGAARITFSAHEGKFEIVGSEAFVSEHLERFATVIQAASQNPRKLPLVGTARGAVESDDGPSSGNGAHGDRDTVRNARADAGNVGWEEKYENVFAVADDKVQLLADLPGASVALRMVSAALLLAYANDLRGSPETSFDSIRDLCKAHGSLDGPNFSKTIKSEKDAFVFGGSRRKQTVKLTVPGRRRAQALAESLSAANAGV